MDTILNLFSDGAGIVASMAGGGLFGLIGSVVGMFGKMLQAKQQQAIRREEWEHELDLQELQIKRGNQETENEIAIAASEGAWRGLSDSVKADAKLTGKTHMWVNDIRALFRLVLTLVLIVMQGWMFQSLMTALLMKDSIFLAVFSEVELKALIGYIVYSGVFSASTAVVWWFGDRALTPPGMKHR